MRGDSLRDLYAKTLALLGLGVLAGVGALVDFWPVGFNLPHLAPVLQYPQVAVALPADSRAFASDIETTVTRRVDGEVMAVAQAPFDAMVIPVTAPGDEPLGRSISLPEPAVRVLAMVATPAPDPEALQDVAAMALAHEDAFDSFVPQMVRFEPVGLADEDDGRGFVTTAFKKTGSSIARTGVRTGASIVDAVRAVGGVVRRALPN